MSKLKYHRLLIPALTLAVLSGAVSNVVLMGVTLPGHSFFVIALYVIFSLLCGLGVVAIIWSVAEKWPKAGGVLFLLLAAFGAWGLLSGFPEGTVLKVLFIIMDLSFAAAGVMLFFATKVVREKTAATEPPVSPAHENIS